MIKAAGTAVAALNIVVASAFCQDAAVFTPEAWKQASSKEGVAKQLEDAAGGRRVKVIWNRGGRDQGRLMGFDTEEGRERVIVPAPVTCTFAFFTGDGKRIVFSSDESEQTAYVVDWDGKNLQKFLTGRHYTVHGTWRDPATGIEWVYVSDCNSKEASAEIKASGKPGWAEKFGHYYGLSVYRYRLDNPSVREVVWDKYPIGARSPVSADGTMLAVEMDWPACGVVPVPNGTYKIIGSGCNPHVAPDGSGMFFNLIGDHRNITIYDKSGVLKSKLAINTMPGIKDPERKVWRPRWSNYARLFSVQSADSGPDGDVCVGEFNDTFTAVKSWVRVTDTTDNDGCTLVWVQPAAQLGEKLTDNLDAGMTKAFLNQLESSPQVRSIVMQLDKVFKDKSNQDRAASAAEVLEHIRRWAESQLKRAAALEPENPMAAGAAYQKLAARFSGLSMGAEAAARLKDPALIKEAKAWQYLLKVEKAVKALQEVPGAESSASNRAWMTKNSLRVTEIKNTAMQANRSFSGTVACAKIQEILDQYGIQLL